MADDTIEGLVQWGVDNQHLKGTPEFEAKTQQYKQLRDAAAPPATPAAAAAPAAEPAAAPAAPAKPSNPNSLYNTAARVGVGTLTGIPDIGIAGLNALSRAGYGPAEEQPYFGPMVLDAIGAQPLAQDASLTRQLLEGGASALLGGGGTAIARAAIAAPTAIRAVMNSLSKLGSTTVAPTIGGHYGGEYGEKVGNALGVDPKTTSLLGSLAGGVGGGASARAPERIIDYRYRGMGNENAPAIAQAARNEGVELPASALGNPTIRARENSYANRWGAGNLTQNLRTNARDQVGAAFNDVADARGSLNPVPTTGDIGASIGSLARQGATDLQARASAPQESLLQRVQPDAPADWQPILDRMRQLSADTYAGTARPLEARIAAIESRLPRDPVTGDITSTMGTYNQVKDFRSDTRIAGEGYDPIPSRYARGAEDAATDVMRGTAAQRGVPNPEFDRIMERYATIMGEGGPHEQLTAVAQDARTNAASGYNYLKQGEQDPARLRMLEANTPPRTQGQPLSPLDQTFGDYLRLIGNQTINSPNQGAAGQRQFATRIENMNPESLDVLAGPQRGRVEDIATIARALNQPTRQGGLGQTVGQINRDIPAALTFGEMGRQLGGLLDFPGSQTLGQAIGYAVGPAQRAIGGRMMQSPTAMRALEGAPYQGNYGINDLIAALTAASQSQTQGAPLPGPRRVP